MFVNGDYGYYLPQNGQNYIYENSSYYKSTPHDWTEYACMVKKTSFQPLNQEKCDINVDTLIIANSPVSNLFQHIIDRVGVNLLQSRHLWKNKNLSVLIEPPNSNQGNQYIKSIIPIFDKFYNSRTPEHICANKIIYSCRTPLIHPYHSYYFHNLINLTFAPLFQRKIILYLSRNNGGTCNERKIINEGELIESIKAHKNNYDLMMFNNLVQYCHNDLPCIQKYISQNVIAIIGPHGGAWYHHRWAGSDILLIEFIPSNRHAIMFWEEGSILNQRYFPLIIESYPPKFDMVAPTQKVLNILDYALNKTNIHSTVELYYYWDLI